MKCPDAFTVGELADRLGRDVSFIRRCIFRHRLITVSRFDFWRRNNIDPPISHVAAVEFAIFLGQDPMRLF